MEGAVGTTRKRGERQKNYEGTRTTGRLKRQLDQVLTKRPPRIVNRGRRESSF